MFMQQEHAVAAQWGFGERMAGGASSHVVAEGGAEATHVIAGGVGGVGGGGGVASDDSVVHGASGGASDGMVGRRGWMACHRAWVAGV